MTVASHQWYKVYMSKNPRLLYGESIFTSFRSVNGVIYGLEDHLERVLSGVNEYYFLNSRSDESITSYFNVKIKVQDLAKINQNHYFRVTFFNSTRYELMPEGFGLSDIEMEISTEEVSFSANHVSLKTLPTPFSENYKTIKSGSYFQHLYFKRMAKNCGFDDVLFERSGDVLEASTSNIILFKENKITFMKGKGIFPGITQVLLSKYASELGVEVDDRVVRVRHLGQFTGAALINSVQFVKPIYRINDISYDTKQAISLRDNFLKVLQELK
jgi:branched-subunit amino acid aminotransferase/4-amino-4-deoxychorismate lyase